ncbi:hypothetical protein J0895_03520 [Phormidium pseudopriestleyi FRX01]|uniref:Uncharacterized protein n=1 Tax=Phormidium pseudopriestleyi FRX01 TaxID=1759528 RepID=A0ABS3FM49_9CYAN|nr:hypothetical protein [Phormidium pseudopriestleyi]MBO0348186.1 hypothetical protein [Phormidium pseudopriestleyi FRX01]
MKNTLVKFLHHTRRKFLAEWVGEKCTHGCDFKLIEGDRRGEVPEHPQSIFRFSPILPPSGPI